MYVSGSASTATIRQQLPEQAPAKSKVQPLVNNLL